MANRLKDFRLDSRICGPLAKAKQPVPITIGSKGYYSEQTIQNLNHINLSTTATIQPLSTITCPLAKATDKGYCSE